MTIRPDDIDQLLHKLTQRWEQLTQGTTRAAGVAMCMLLLCAVVVGGSQVLPFASVRDDAATPASEVSLDSDDADSPDDVETVEESARQLERIDYNESWLQVSTDWDRLGDLPRRHQVLITPGGELAGRIMTFADWRGDVKPLSNAPVHLMQNGAVAAETTTDADGRFVAGGLTEGTYSLIVESAEGLLAYALHVHTAETDADAVELQLESMAATAWDTDAIIERVLNYWQSGPPIERTREPAAEEIPEPVKPIPQRGASATTLLHHQAHLQDDGRLIGRLRRLHPTTGRPIIAREIEVAIYRNGSLQGVTWTDDIGYFEFPRVAPGVYSLVATGAVQAGDAYSILPAQRHGLRHGVLAFGVDVLPAESTQLVKTVAFQSGAELEIDAALVDLQDIQPFLGPPEAKSTGDAAAGPFANAGSSAGTGSSSGSGGVGGGDVLGTALAAGAVAGLAALVANDDGVVSPARP